MKIYVNKEIFDSTEISALTKSEFMATNTKIIGLEKEKLYDKITLTSSDFLAKVKAGYYTEKTELQKLQEVVEALLLESLGG